MLAILVLVLGLMVCLSELAKAAPMGTAFTYQGRLMDANAPAEELYDFEFKLYDDANTITGNQLGSTIDINDLDVFDGYFTVELDFGSSVFDGNSVWLEIDVRLGDSNEPNDFVTLSPRQEITPTPYALQTRGIFVDNVLNVGIGTTSPVGKLHVDGGKAMDGTWGADVVIKAQDGGDGWEMQNNGVAGGDIILLPGEGGEEYGVGFPGPDGNVGIGTTEPGAKLDIIGDLATRNPGSTPNGSQILLSSPQGNPGLVIQLGDGTGNRLNQWVTGVHSDESYYIQERGASGSQGTKHMVIASGGNVGIGTTDPHDGKLVIANDATDEAYISLQPGGTALNDFMGLRVSESGNNTTKLHFGREFTTNTSFRDQVTLDGANGNVGIGTTNPTAVLDVMSRGTSEDVIAVHASDGSELFNVNEMGFGDGEVLIRDRAGAWKVRLSAAGFSLFNGGNVGIGDVGIPTRKLVVRGNILVQSEVTGNPVLELGEGLDYAEGFDVTEEADIEAGTVLVIDSDNPGKLTVSRSAYDSKVAGIVAGANGMGSGVRLGVGQFDHDVALAGRVYCKVDATQTAVQAGDLLTTSATAGYAMKATDYDRARGAILGKAMQRLELGQKAQILVLVTLQ